MAAAAFAVGLTDYVLAIECACFALLLFRANAPWQAMRRLFIAFFGFTALASLAGGVYHQLLLSDMLSIPAAMLWKLTIVAIGAATLATWCIGAHLLFTQPTTGRIVKAAAAAFILFALYAMAVNDDFRVAIVNYIPAVAFLGIAFTCCYRRQPATAVMLGLLGLCVSGVAAAIQQLGFSLHPVYFNHNATYHLIQAIGLWLIFRAAIFFVRNPQPAAGKGCIKI